jgi:hypothetical protein
MTYGMLGRMQHCSQLTFLYFNGVQTGTDIACRGTETTLNMLSEGPSPGLVIFLDHMGTRPL